MSLLQEAARSGVSSTMIGNIVALAVLVWKTTYDLWWNERLFRRATTDERDLKKLSAAVSAKQARSRNSTILTFAVLAASYFVFIIGEIYSV